MADAESGWGWDRESSWQIMLMKTPIVGFWQCLATFNVEEKET